jgi:hypothetical protein
MNLHAGVNVNNKELGLLTRRDVNASVNLRVHAVETAAKSHPDLKRYQTTQNGSTISVNISGIYGLIIILGEEISQTLCVTQLLVRRVIWVDCGPP